MVIGSIYNSPINSSYNKNNDCDLFEHIQKNIRNLSLDNHIIVGGDFNARVGDAKDYFEENQSDIEYLSLPQNYQICKCKKKRTNQDEHKNKYGEKLTELAITSNMKILNGRTIGDLLGKYTYIGYNGASTVDYVLCSEEILNYKS